MVSRKRGREEMEASGPEPAQEPTMLQKLRNTWELANLMQYIFLFGKALKIDEDLDIDDLEQECLKPEKSKVLNEIGLALLKFVSSHRGLTPEIFDEYTRRQYVAKAPQRNPFGDEEEPKRFVDFDVFLKLKVLVQLSQWTLLNPDRLRERMPEAKEIEQTQWRIEETGWDRHERSYFVLDDNRLYRRTDPPPPPLTVPKTKPKATSKKGKAAARANRRRKAAEPEDTGEDADVDTGAENAEEGEKLEDDDGFGGRKWECIAVTLDQYREFLASIEKSRDPDEKALHARVTETVLPDIERLEASHVRKKQKQERELLNLQKLATAKRSSRLEAKFEREKQEQEAAETERRKREDLAAAKRDLEKQKVMEAARESRMMTREQRLKDREFKRLLHEEELANLSEENKKIEAGESQRSERHLKAEMEKKKKDLAALQEEEDWMFDCAKCGIYGSNLDDGSPSIACEKCNVWQHTACLGFSQEEAKKDDFHFICRDCKRREEDAKKPKIPTLKFHIGSSSSPPQSNSKPLETVTNGLVTNGVKRKSGEGSLPPMKKFKQQKSKHAAPAISLGGGYQSAHSNHDAMHNTIMNGPQLSPQGQMKISPPANGKSHSPSQDLSPKPPGHTFHNNSPGQNYSSFGTFQAYSKVAGYSSGQNQNIGAAGPEKHNHLPKSKPSDPSSNAQNQRSYDHRYPPPARSPSQQPGYNANANGHPYQSPQYSYQQQSSGFATPSGAQPNYQTYRGYGQPSVLPANAWSSHYNPPNLTPPSQHLPPYEQSSATQDHPHKQESTAQRPVNVLNQIPASSGSSLSPSNPNPNNQDRPVSSTTLIEPQYHLPKTTHTSASPPHSFAPVLTPGPRAHSPKTNGYTYSPIPPSAPQTQSPVKHPSPPTSFTHPPASSPISNQPPLQPTTNAPTSPGISPQKHSPPPSIASAHGPHPNAAVNAPAVVLPPAPKLSPSPTTSPTVAPLKLEAHNSVNAAAPILSPNSAPQSFPSPIKQTLMPVQEPSLQPAEPRVDAVNGHSSS